MPHIDRDFSPKRLVNVVRDSIRTTLSDHYGSTLRNRMPDADAEKALDAAAIDATVGVFLALVKAGYRSVTTLAEDEVRIMSDYGAEEIAKQMQAGH
jgi:hypothetical protein